MNTVMNVTKDTTLIYLIMKTKKNCPNKYLKLLKAELIQKIGSLPNGAPEKSLQLYTTHAVIYLVMLYTYQNQRNGVTYSFWRAKVIL